MYEGELRICSACGYGRGFHVWLEPVGQQTRIGLICPSCGQSYRIGWVVPEMAGGAQRGEVY